MKKSEITELWSKINFDYEITKSGYDVICVNAFHLNRMKGAVSGMANSFCL